MVLPLFFAKNGIHWNYSLHRYNIYELSQTAIRSDNSHLGAWKLPNVCFICRFELHIQRKRFVGIVYVFVTNHTNTQKGRIVSFITQVTSFICGIILCCVKSRYNPRPLFCDILKNYLPFSEFTCTHRYSKPMDNGLLLLFNQKPDQIGSEAFNDSVWEDSLADKGFLWAYFNKHNILVINTHLQVKFTSSNLYVIFEEKKRTAYFFMISVYFHYFMRETVMSFCILLHIKKKHILCELGTWQRRTSN